ncbi:MAG: DedA family protein [Microbacteriaceae bacterium]|nr:DedA family protein [Microbacteriaceae bacterium]
MAQDLDDGVHDPVHLREERLRDQHDSHGIRVRRLGESGVTRRPARTERSPGFPLGGPGSSPWRGDAPCRSPASGRTVAVGIPWLDALVGSWWLYPALYLLVVADAFLVVIPGEIAVSALGALAVATDPRALWLVIPVAAAGALTGDLACYAIGRSVGLDRWRWQREGRTRAAIDRFRVIVDRRTAVLVFTARYIPFARIAVNLCVGAARLPLARYLPLAAIAGLCWALFQAGVGTAFGAIFRGQPLLAVVCSVVAALVLGVLVDRVVAVARAARARRAERS